MVNNHNAYNLYDYTRVRTSLGLFYIQCLPIDPCHLNLTHWTFLNVVAEGVKNNTLHFYVLQSFSIFRQGFLLWVLISIILTCFMLLFHQGPGPGAWSSIHGSQEPLYSLLSPEDAAAWSSVRQLQEACQVLHHVWTQLLRTWRMRIIVEKGFPTLSVSFLF